MADKLTTIKQLEACAAAAKNFTNDLAGEIAEATASAIEEMDTLKADKSAAPQISITEPENWPRDGWWYEVTGSPI